MASIDNFSKLCVHTQTTKPWTIQECVSHFSAAGIKGISIWRHLLEGKDLKSIKAMLDAHQMEVVSLVRGGFSCGRCRAKGFSFGGQSLGHRPGGCPRCSFGGIGLRSGSPTIH